jgi:membrane protein implicated in regulation of membrane protease activity
LAVVLSLAVFVVPLLAFLVALLFVDGVAWPATIGVFCGLAAATALNATDITARRSRRDSIGDRDNQRGKNGRVP